MSTIKLFETNQVRSAWDHERQIWYFSIVDVVGVLTDSADATTYGRKLKRRLKADGNETVTNCHGLKSEGSQLATNCSQLKMQSTDVIMR